MVKEMAEALMSADADVRGDVVEGASTTSRRAVFHADYSLHDGEFRIQGRVYTHDEIQTLVNRALAYHDALAFLVREQRWAYTEPKLVSIQSALAHDPDERGIVMVRDGVGAITVSGERYDGFGQRHRFVDVADDSVCAE